MKVEEMADAINQYLDKLRQESNSDKRSYFVVRKHQKPVENFKAFKQFTIELWLIDKEPKRIITTEVTGRMIEGRDELFLKQIDREFIIQLIVFIDTGKLKEYV